MPGETRFFAFLTIVMIQAGTVVLISNTVQGAVPGLTPEKNCDVSGYVTYRVTASYPDQQSHSVDQILHQRLNAEYRFQPDFRLNAGLRNRMIWGDSIKDPSYTAQIAQDSGYFDLSSNWQEDKGITGNSQLDRLYFTWDRQDWQVKGGRQRINWGMATIWNPNDLFNTYSLYDIDYAERPGTDAVMISYKTGYASGAELVFNPNENHELNGWSGRWFFNAHGWDMQLLGGTSGRDNVLGLGFSGDIIGAGFSGELSYFHPDHSDWQGKKRELTPVATLEADYSFSGERNWSVKAAWLYIKEPVSGLASESFLNQSSSARTLSFSRYSYYGETGVDVSALLRVIFSGVYYQDNSYYLSLSGQYSLANNWQLHNGMQYFGGTDDSVHGQEANTLVYMLLKYSF